MAAQKMSSTTGHESPDQYDASIESARSRVIQAWVRERFQAKTESELMELLQMVDRSQQSLLQDVIHGTIQEQQFQLGAATYYASFFAIPITVTFEDEPTSQAFDLKPLLPGVMKALQSCGLSDPKAGLGAAMMTRLVPHASLRSLSYAKMFALVRELFYSSLAMHSPPRVSTLKPDASSMTFELADKHAFAGYVLGCFYQKRKQAARTPAATEAFAKRVADLLRMQFLDPIRPTKVSVGNLVPLYKAFEEGGILNATMLASTLMQCWSESVSAVGINVDFAPNDHHSNRVTLRLKDDLGGVLTEGAIDLNAHERGALQRVLQSIEQACLEAAPDITLEGESSPMLH